MTGEGEPEVAPPIIASEMTEGEIVSEAADAEVAESEPKQIKLKKKEMKAILEMKMKFKKVGLEQALTEEEKAAKKAARLAKKKKGKKEESTHEVAAEKRQEDTKEKMIEKIEETKEGEQTELEDETGKKKAKKSKKAKQDEEISEKEKKGKEEKTKVADAQEQPIVEDAGEKPEGKKKPKRKMGKKISDVETTIEEEGDEGKQKEEGKETTAALTTEEEKKPKGKKGKKKSGTKLTTEEEGDESKKNKEEKEIPEIPETSEALTTEEKKKQKRKKGKKKSDAELDIKEEGDEGKQKTEEKEIHETSEAPTMQDEGGDVSEKTKKQKKKKKKGIDVVPSDTTKSQPPTEGDELGKAGKAGRKKKTSKKEKQVEGSKVSMKVQSSKKSLKLGAAVSVTISLGSEVSSSSSEEDLVEKVEKKRKKPGKKQRKSVDMSEEKKAKEEEPKKDEEPKPKKDEEPKPKKDEEPKRKKKKKKKGDEPEAVDESDIVAVIQRMKAQTETQATGDEVLEEKPATPSKKKKKGEEGPKKKLTKKQRALLAQEQAEKARIQAEIDAQRLIEEEKKRIQEERKMAKEKDKRETAEQVFRNEQLSLSTGLIKAMLDQNWKISDKEKSDAEWAQYLKCDGLPNPINPPQMNTYLHLWEQVINDVTVEEVVRRTNEVLELLETLQDYIDDPFDVSESLVEDWKWIRGLCRDHQKETHNMATYRLLRDIDSRLNRIDIPTADFNISDKNFNLCLYVLVQLPTPMYNPRNVSKTKLEIDFSAIKMKVVYPLSVDSKFVATRAMYLRYDHLSDTCATYDPITIPAQYEMDLLKATSEEWYKQLLYKYENRKRPEKKTVEDEFGNLVEIEPEPEPELVEGELPPAVPFQILEPPAPQYVVEMEDDIYANNRADKRLEMVLEENVINLRKYMIIGGVYCLELFYQPPQPKDLVAFEVRLTALKLPKRLEEVPVYIQYVPPPPEDPLVQKTPEELEQDVKKQEEVLDSLISIRVTLPEHVMFLDLPIVCQWDSERKVWTTQEVIDLKHIEEQNYITFRTGLFGPFALGVNRYLNFPFQMWEIKPETDGTVTFQLTCAILMIEFNIKKNTICMTQLQNSPNNALQDVIGIYFKLSKLIRILRDGGVDIFPAYDTFKYVEGACEKQWPVEKHTYYSMGLLSCTFNFTYSRWNNQAGRRKLVMQMREYHPDKPKQKSHNMLLVTPLNAVYINCTEVSPAFNETPIGNLKFCSDMFHLMKATCSITTRNKVLNGPQDVAKALADILIATRILSFSS